MINVNDGIPRPTARPPCDLPSDVAAAATRYERPETSHQVLSYVALSGEPSGVTFALSPSTKVLRRRETIQMLLNLPHHDL